MVERDLGAKIKRMSELFPIVVVTGPRQSGKSTLVRELFPNYKYVSLESPDMRYFAETDPKGFLSTFPTHTIIDEVQRVSELFSYLQTHVDRINESGMYILSGSQNFLLMDRLTQSLAGRAAILKLLPFSRKELKNAGILPASVEEELLFGGYPRLFDKGMTPHEYYPSYIQTYVERDLRQLKNIGDLGLFMKFIKLCAGRIGQLVNFSSLANDCGVAVSTAQSWLSLLETSYIVYTLRPDFNNFNKRLVKSPKLYFYDTGLACELLEIQNANQLSSHYLRGGLFENLIINEFTKDAYNQGENPNLSFWRDNKGNEIDLIKSVGTSQFAFEIKSGHTFSDDYFSGLKYWAKISGSEPNHSTVIYCGDESLQTSNGKLLSINDL